MTRAKAERIVAKYQFSVTAWYSPLIDNPQPSLPITVSPFSTAEIDPTELAAAIETLLNAKPKRRKR